jgi:hypothetical protein
VANAHQQLGVGRLRQGEVERAEADPLHHPLHARPDHHAEEARHEREDTDERNELVARPAGQLVRLAEHDGEPGERRRKVDERLHQLHREIGAVLERVECTEPEREPDEPEVATHPYAPTAE